VLKLVYACLAFSAAAIVFLIIASANGGSGYHGMTNEMGAALTEGAAVLSADAHGTITETGNGNVAGYARGSKSRSWSTSFDRFPGAAGSAFGGNAIDALATCAGNCPSAIVTIGGEPRAEGGASAELTTALSKIEGGASVLAAASASEAFAKSLAAPPATTPLTWLVGSTSAELGVPYPSDVQLDADGKRALVGSSVSGSGRLTSLSRVGKSWKPVGDPTIERGLKNACISRDGQWIGAVSTRLRRIAFDGTSAAVIKPAVTGGKCTVDAAGISAAYTTSKDPRILYFSRFDASGKMLWTKNLGAQRLLSPSDSPYLVAQAGDTTLTVVDAVSGDVKLTRKAPAAPYVSRDGSIVNADRGGHPTWLLVGPGQTP
jgi:hypothetical protein